MSRLWELQIWDANGESRTIRVRAMHEEEAWRVASLQDGEGGAIKEVIEEGSPNSSGVSQGPLGPKSTVAKPHLLVPTSDTAKWLVGGLYALAVFLPAYVSYQNYHDPEEAFVVAASNAVAWLFLIAVFRYAVFVYPWERKNRR